MGEGQDGCLFIVQFSFVEYEICEVFDDVLVYFSHESFKDGFGNGEVIEHIYNDT